MESLSNREINIITRSLFFGIDKMQIIANTLTGKKQDKLIREINEATEICWKLKEMKKKNGKCSRRTNKFIRTSNG